MQMPLLALISGAIAAFGNCVLILQTISRKGLSEQMKARSMIAGMTLVAGIFARISGALASADTAGKNAGHEDGQQENDDCFFHRILN
jgi:hypothetical protein